MNNKVLLYSGGLDSYIMAHMFPEAALLYIDSGAGYSWKEIYNLPNAPRQVELRRDIIKLDERADSIVPCRNLYLVTIAAEYGDTVLLSATAGDNSTDKDDTFARKASDILTYIYSSGHFPERVRPIKVQLPAKHMSKREMIEWYIKEGFDIEKLKNTISCYMGNRGHCGQCKACIRKWLAFAACGIQLNDFIKSPIEYNWQPVIDKINSDEGWRCTDEDSYTLRVLDEYGISK